MPYSKISFKSARKFFLFTAILFTGAGTAHADILQDCRQKEKTAEDISSCIIAAHQRSRGELRDLDKSIVEKFQTTKDRNALRRYENGEAIFVRQRIKRCGSNAKKNAPASSADVEQTRFLCEAASNFSHAEELRQRYP